MSLVEEKPQQQESAPKTVELLTAKQVGARVSKAISKSESEIRVLLPSQLLDGAQVFVTDKEADASKNYRVYATARLKFVNEAVFDEKTDVMCIKAYFSDLVLM